MELKEPFHFCGDRIIIIGLNELQEVERLEVLEYQGGM